MEAVVQLRAEISRLMRNNLYAHKSRREIMEEKAELDAALARAGASLVPQHPDAEDEVLASYFMLTGVSDPEMDSVLTALRGLDAVMAAYVKPGAELA